MNISNSINSFQTLLANLCDVLSNNGSQSQLPQINTMLSNAISICKAAAAKNIVPNCITAPKEYIAPGKNLDKQPKFYQTIKNNYKRHPLRIR